MTVTGEALAKLFDRRLIQDLARAGTEQPASVLEMVRKRVGDIHRWTPYELPDLKRSPEARMLAAAEHRLKLTGGDDGR